MVQGFGMHKELAPLSYPKILKVGEVPEIKSMFVYPIKAYRQDGISITFNNVNGDIALKFSDWDGRNISKSVSDDMISKYGQRLTALVVAAKIQQAQLYLSDGVLVDVRTHVDNFIGPGMINDVFSKVIPTQTILGKPFVLDDEALKSVIQHKPPFVGPMILKTSLFKTIIRGKSLIPLYALVP